MTTENEIGELGLPFPSNHASLPTFEYLVTFLEVVSVIRGTGSILKRQQTVTAFIRQWREDIGTDIYPAFQLLLPHIDDRLRHIQISESSLAKMLVSSLHINVKSTDAILLMQSKKVFTRHKPLERESASAEDLGVRCQTAVSKRTTVTKFSNWTLSAVSSKLIEFGEANKSDRQKIIDTTIAELSPIEIKWFIRILLRSVKTDCSERTILQCFHPNSTDLYKVVNSLKLICNQLWDPQVTLQKRDTGIRLGSCFKPMRAKFIPGVYSDLDVVVAKMNPTKTTKQQKQQREPSRFYIEEKVDGERVQLHYTDGGKTCRYFSRRGYEYSTLYGTSVDSKEGTLTPYLKSCISETTMSCILDGEMVAFDTENNEICAVSNVRQTAKVKGNRLRNVFLVFDCLYKNGHDLSGYCLQDRKKVLNSILKSGVDNVVRMLPSELGTCKEDIQKHLDRGIDNMSEGVVIKNPLGSYVFDGRIDSWIKVKPEFVNGYMGENFDLIVVGAYKGKKGRKEQYASYLCALRSGANQYTALCRVASGITTALYQYIDDQLRPHMFSGDVPNWLQLNESKPDAWVSPERSIVIEVKATQILSNSNGFSLRFPRFVKIREDKDRDTCMSMLDFEDYRRYLDSKASSRKRVGCNITGNGKRRNLVSVSDSTDIEVKSHIFKDQMFSVSSDIDSPRFMSAEQISRILVEHGGNVSRLLNSDTIIIGDKKTPNVVAYLLHEPNPRVIHPRWIFDCIDANKILEFEPLHYFIGNANMSLVDRFGFSLYRKQPLSDISELFDRMMVSQCSANKISLARDCVFPKNDSETKSTMFQHTSVYIQSCKKLAVQLLRYGGARFVDDYKQATHVVNDIDVAHSEKPTLNSETIYSLWMER